MGAQFQGEAGGIAHHFLYRCNFEKTSQGDPRAKYPQASGHGFRINGDTQKLAFEDCTFRDNSGFGIQSGGGNVSGLRFSRCAFTKNLQGSSTGFLATQSVQFQDCAVEGQNANLPPTKWLAGPPPSADFRAPAVIYVGTPAQFDCVSKPGTGQIVERLWDFNHGTPELSASTRHTFDQTGRYRVTLIVWDAAGQGARVEKMIEVRSVK